MGSCIPHASEEENDVLPPPCDRMDQDHPRPFAPLEHTASHRLALWSLGMALARSCALTAVSAFLATWLHRKEPAVRQQLREFCYEATAKRGTTRCALAVEPCFVPLLAWVVDQWEGTQLALALDATTLGTRFTVLALSVVYRGCAIPVAWTVLAATAKHAWRRSGCGCCARFASGPTGLDRNRPGGSGLVCPLAVSAYHPVGPDPFLRINTGGTFRPTGQVRGVPLKTLVPSTRHDVAGHGDRLQRPPPPAPLHAAGVLGGGVHRPLVDPDGPATRGQHCLLVWVAGLDSARLQDHQARLLAVAAHPHDPARAGRAPVAGRRRGDLVAAECRRARRRRRSRPARCRTSRRWCPSRRGRGVPPACGRSVSFAGAGT